MARSGLISDTGLRWIFGPYLIICRVARAETCDQQYPSFLLDRKERARISYLFTVYTYQYFQKEAFMKRIRNMAFFISIVSVFFCVQVEAAYIIDTGPATTTGNFLGRDDPNFQYLAGQFTVDEGYAASISGIEGWMFHAGELGINNELTIAIYGTETYSHPFPVATLPRPDVDNEYYTTTFVGPTDSVPDWHGVGGLEWDLAAGTYWVAFEARPGQDFSGSMQYTVPAPMDMYAYYTNGNPGYYKELTGKRWGFRIEGSLNQSAVPVPGAVWLLGSGFVALLGLRRKRVNP